ncbi:outer membrane beta-barrel protein [Flavobacteriaceae bacterium]|nr:PorT family protein [Flavobacteriaceae bacterium]MDC1167495.1 outer membrane beta-barrel protein [Flavobacteriaceae bacterium]
MKKIIFACFLLTLVTKNSQAQLQFGLKAGVNYNSDSFESVSNDVLNGAKTKTGIHTGLWLRAKLPVIGFYIRPEIVYTELNNSVNYESPFSAPKTTDFKFRKIDVPVLIGKKFLGIGNVFAGPSFQYILSSDFELNDLREVSTESFSLGIQLGAGIELGRLGIDLRWERGLSKTETVFVDNTIFDSNFNFDKRVSQIIFGISYKLSKVKKD